MRYLVLNRFAGALLGSYIGENLAVRSDSSNLTQTGIDNLKKIWYADETDSEIDRAKQTNTSIESIFVTSLPELLLFYESRDLLEEKLSKMESVSPENRLALKIWGSAIASACQEKPQQDNRSIVDRTVSLEMRSQIKKWLEGNKSLDGVVEELEQTNRSPYSAIALALYCFCSTPEDFQICVKRAVKANYQPKITAALTGAIAGAYNSIVGIPLYWRSHSLDIECIYKFARELFCYWSGTYRSDISSKMSEAIPIVAAKNLQSRSGFKTISQK